MKTTVIIQNMKCTGCMGTISKKLHAMEDVEDLFIELENSTVSYSHHNQDTSKRVQKILSQLGYPVACDENTLANKAKSYVSCGIGRMKS